MSVVTYEGIVENGRVQLPAGVLLPEKAKVYVVVPENGVRPTALVASPRLARPEYAQDFIKEVMPERPDASL